MTISTNIPPKKPIKEQIPARIPVTKAIITNNSVRKRYDNKTDKKTGINKKQPTKETTNSIFANFFSDFYHFHLTAVPFHCLSNIYMQEKSY